MVTFELNKEEAQVLKGHIKKELVDLHSEIVHTDDWEFRNYLKEVRSILIRIHQRLEKVLGGSKKTPGPEVTREVGEA